MKANRRELIAGQDKNSFRIWMGSHVLMDRQFNLFLKETYDGVCCNYCRYEHQKVEFPAGGLSQTE